MFVTAVCVVFLFKLRWSKNSSCVFFIVRLKVFKIPCGSLQLWVIFLAETSKDLEMILITTVLSCTNSLSRTSFDFSLKTSFVYSNLFSLAKTVTKNSFYP